MKVKWNAWKNTERTAITKFGDEWEVVQSRAGMRLIKPLHDGNDLRWINDAQVKEVIE